MQKQEEGVDMAPTHSQPGRYETAHRTVHPHRGQAANNIHPTNDNIKPDSLL